MIKIVFEKKQKPSKEDKQKPLGFRVLFSSLRLVALALANLIIFFL